MSAKNAHLEIQNPAKGETVLLLTGQLNVFCTGLLFDQIKGFFDLQHPPKIVIECRGIKDCDTSGILLLQQIRQTAKNKQIPCEIQNLDPHYSDLLESMQLPEGKASQVTPESTGAVEKIGAVTAGLFGDLREQLVFLGHVISALFRSFLQPRRIRYIDFWRTCENAGADALPIILLLGILFGLILAFSSAMPLKQFGVEIYVADLVAIGLTRVLGPFITAIILAGRTGSAFAAELGTMKINNEIDALEVMALDPIQFLVVPRFLAMVLIAPLLTMVTNVAGILGATFVIHSLGYPLITIWSHIQNMLNPTDVLVGLVKAVVYGALVAGFGTLRGLQTGFGSGAVGQATTRAVVSIIISLVITEGVFSIILFFLEI